jgi:hypothetical protein
MFRPLLRIASVIALVGLIVGLGLCGNLLTEVEVAYS